MKHLYVVDTNILVSAMLTKADDSPPLLIVRGMLNGNLRFLLSTELLAEYRAVLLRPKLMRLHGLDVDEVDALLAEIAANGTHREPDTHPSSPDPNDAHLLALLDCEPRAVLVTGDDRLRLALPPTYHERTITPREAIG
ncbi:putative toxin-antitoxin system toxin component, PIN family [uncultured Nevskia sp.]|uniref:putative toxin-antitoxin system toxin component, PIN family n=1 Tax=uncultured Nevskia sp. TaxID=228950 RepID=UPI0025D830A2|nr:putative toxin-antitoxin system toxin component, PIN family [uncultured Nevskia sp.]